MRTPSHSLQGHRRDARDRAFAFAFTDLLAMLAGLTLAALVVLPALANTRPRSHRIACANNLRQLGAGTHLWAEDHFSKFPQETWVTNGGTRLHSLAANAWLHFSWLSNELAGPQLLFCPSDTGRPARDFSGDPGGGYVHPNFANRATSYLVAYRTMSTDSGTEPVGMIAADRNITTYPAVTCGNFGTANRIYPDLTITGYWTSGLHGNAGNVLLHDGRAEIASNNQLRRALSLGVDANSTKHVVLPR